MDATERIPLGIAAASEAAVSVAAACGFGWWLFHRFHSPAALVVASIAGVAFALARLLSSTRTR